MSEKTVLGKALHESKGSKNLIITLQADTRIGQPVSDKNGKMIGKVFDIFGPVETPYASIRLNDGVELGKIENKPVFLGRAPEKKKRRKQRRSR